MFGRESDDPVNMDILHNIESGIAQIYQGNRELKDTEVIRALDALIDYFRREANNHEQKEHTLGEHETTVFDAVKLNLDLRNGNASVTDPTAYVAALRKIHKSSKRWNKRGGKRGYLDFIKDYV